MYHKKLRLVAVFAAIVFMQSVLAMAQNVDQDDQLLQANGYKTQSIDGWTVLVSDKLLSEKPGKTSKALALLESQLQGVKKVLPNSAFEKLHRVPIWLSPPYPNNRPTGEYHPGRRWLIQNKRDPKLAKCIEFTNIDRFEKEIKRMPMLVLHELAHAYHDQVLGFDNDLIKKEFQRVVDDGTYNSVFRPITNRTEKAYALSNAREYFAETSEAYFGQNDYYPLTNDQLKRHDPNMHKLLGMLWGVN